MKVINEKGKLFGLINLVDLLVIVLIVLIAVGATYKTTGQDAAANYQKIEYTVLLPCVRPEPAAAIQVGDKLVANNKFTNAVITEVVQTPGQLVSTTAEGTRVRVTDPYLVDVLVTAQDQVSLNSATITAGGQELRAGKKYYLKSRDYEFDGIVQKITFLGE